MASSEEEVASSNYDSINDSYNSQSEEYNDIERKVFGKEPGETIYCCICAGKHAETNCPNKANSRDQFHHARDRFTQQTSFKQVG